MNGAFLTQVFNPFVAKYSYFNKKNLTLKYNIVALFSLVLTLGAAAQNPANIEFVENKGQWDDRIRFKGNVNSGSFIVRNGGFTIVQHNPQDLAVLGRFTHGFKMDG